MAEERDSDTHILKVWGLTDIATIEAIASRLEPHTTYMQAGIIEQLESGTLELDINPEVDLPVEVEDALIDAELSYSFSTFSTDARTVDITMYHAPSGESTRYDVAEEKIVLHLDRLESPNVREVVMSARRAERRQEQGLELGLIIAKSAHESIENKNHNKVVFAYLNDTLNGTTLQ